MNGERTRLTSAELGEELGLAQSTLRGWRADGRGPRWYKLGRHAYYDREDIEAWIAEQKVQHDLKASKKASA